MKKDKRCKLKVFKENFNLKILYFLQVFNTKNYNVFFAQNKFLGDLSAKIYVLYLKFVNKYFVEEK